MMRWPGACFQEIHFKLKGRRIIFKYEKPKAELSVLISEKKERLKKKEKARRDQEGHYELISDSTQVEHIITVNLYTHSAGPSSFRKQTPLDLNKQIISSVIV